MVALEKMIKELEQRISVSRGQLSKHNSGEEKLSRLAESSAENSLEKHIPLLENYKTILKEFEKIEKLDSYEHRRLRAAIERKKYYKYNKQENQKKKIKYKENDERIEAAMIIDELPEEILLDTAELFSISSESLQEYIPFPKNAEQDLLKIQTEFNKLIKNFTDEHIKSLELLNYMIPIVIFHFEIFRQNILEVQLQDSSEENLALDFFPKYHDWWISELWSSHIAYFSLFRWKRKVAKLCKTENQKNAWKILFHNWIFVKTLLSEKSNPAFEYQYIFDKLLNESVQLSSELNKSIVKNSREKMKKFINKEDLFSLIEDHHVLTPYVNYKKLYDIQD